MSSNSDKAKLVLKDGTIFEGKSFGAGTSTAGEVVFATGMVGYDQSLTDPSYAGQILTFTYPLIGNWGVPPKKFWESDKIQVQGLIVADYTTAPSHWQNQQSLSSWLKSENIPAVSGIDTRKLTQKLRSGGVMLGKIVTGNQDINFWDPNEENLVAQVSPKKLKIWKPTFNFPASPAKRGEQLSTLNSLNIGLLNCGAKMNIIRSLVRRGVTLYDMPWDFDPFEKNIHLDGLVISNGPGNPKMAQKTISTIKKSLKVKLQTFGICLGNQLLALAAGGNTYKLKYGHRAQNQPTIEVNSKRCYITTQNHGFAIDEKRLPLGFERWFFNANDNTNEGIIHSNLPFFSVQFHPEASPGPTDTEFLFDHFLNSIKK